MYDIIIIGAGTAGMSAAIYAVRSGKTVLLLEGKSYGGQIITSKEVENYPAIKHISGFEFAKNLYEQTISLGAVFKYEKVTSIKNSDNKKIVNTNKNQYECKSIIIATGAKNRPLGLERESDFIGNGISYCATCDGAFFRNKTVAVSGGGNTALEDSIFLSQYCKLIYIVHRRDTFRGEERLLNTLKEKDNVKFILNSNIISLIGNDSLDGILVKDKITGEENKIDINGLFIAIGQMPENDIFKDIIALDDKGYVKGGENCKTNADGIFVAGDCRTKAVRQLATAAADGAIAGLAACEWIDAN